MATVELQTTFGVVQLELDESRAPASTQNFLQYVQSGHYDGTLFHRVIPGFMVQGGGMSSGLVTRSTNAPIKNEADNGLTNETGTVAMARTSDPHSATSQFFINVSDNSFLNHRDSNSNEGWGYCVFGKVADGMTVVRQIEGVQTASQGGHGDVPVEEIAIIKATVLSS